MSDLEEGLRALADAAASAARPGDVRRRFRRRRAVWTATAAFAVAALVVTGVVVLRSTPGRDVLTAEPAPSPSAAPSDSVPLESLVRDGRFVRTVSFAAGKVVVEVPPSAVQPVVSEADARELYLASEGCCDERPDAVIGFGLASAVVPGDAGPSVARQPSWVVLWTTLGAGCDGDQRLTVGGEPAQIDWAFVLDSGGTQGVLVFPGNCVDPTSSFARQYVSLAWTEVSRDATSITVRYTLPPCGMIEESSPSPTTTSGQAQLSIVASHPFAALPCPSPAPTTLRINTGFAPGDVLHAPTGPRGPVRHLTADP